MNQMKTFGLLAALTILMMLIGAAAGGQGGMAIGLVIAMVMNIGTWWAGDKLILGMYRARLVEANEAPELHRIVETLAQRAGMPKPKVAIMDNPVPNAFATGRDQNHATVAATTGLMQMLTYDELMGVMGHELSHVRHRDTLISAVAATMAGAIMMVANMMRWGAMFGGFGRRDGRDGGGLVMLATIIIAPIAATLIRMAISRSREYMADQGGAELSGNPRALASALAKIGGVHINPGEYGFSPETAHLMISNPFKMGGLGNLFSTHPPMEERIARLMTM